MGRAHRGCHRAENQRAPIALRLLPNTVGHAKTELLLDISRQQARTCSIRGGLTRDQEGWSEVEPKNNHRRFKVVSAGAGLTAVVAMGALGVLASRASTDVQMWSEPEMTTGETVMQSTAEESPQTSVATPPFTFTTPEGFAVPH